MPADPPATALQAKLLDAVQQAVITTDAQRGIIYWNRFAEQLYGWKAEEVLGRDITEVTAVEQVEAETAMAAIDRGETWSGEFRVKRKSGETFPAFVTVSPIRNDEGQPAGAVGVSFDLSAQKESEFRYESLFRAMSEGFALCEAIRDSSGRLVDYVVVEINPALQAMLGLGPEFQGRKLSDTRLGSPVWLQLCDAVLKTGEPLSLEVQNEGSGRWHEIRVNRVAPGRLAQFFFDITERRAADEQRDLLLREMNHRVKNLFAVMNGVVLLSSRSKQGPEEMARSIRGRLDAIARAHELVLPSVLRAADDQSRRTDLSTLIKAVLSAYADGPRSRAKARLTIEGPHVVVGDKAANALALVLNELATNAIKYGAFADAEGVIGVVWSLEDEQLSLTWRERGGLPVAGQPASEGFGSQLARRSVAGQLAGTLAYDWDAAGLTVNITAPLERLAS